MMERTDVEFDVKDLTFFAPAAELDPFLARHKSTPVAETQQMLKTYGTSTKFFIYLLEAINKLFVPFIKLVENMNTQIERTEKEIEKIPDSDFRKPMMRKFVENLKNEFFLMRILLEDDERIANLNLFYNKLIGILTGLMKSPKPPIIPGYYLTDYIEIQTFLSNIKKGYFAQFGVHNFSLYMQLLDVILSEKYKDANRYIKAKYLDLLYTFNIIEKGAVVGVVRDHLGSKEKLIAFTKALLAFYSEIEFMTEAGGIAQMKHRYRFFITKFLLKALKMSDYQEALVAVKYSPEMNAYVGHLITDLNFFLDEAFEKLQKISKLQSQGDAGIQQMLQRQMQAGQQGQGEGEEDNLQTTENESIPVLTDQVKGLFKFGRSQLQLMDILARLAPEIFSSEEWANKVAQTINYYASKMCAKGYRTYKVADLSKIKLKPLEFITQLIQIYVSMSAIQRVKEAIMNDERSFSSENLIDLGRTATAKQLVPDDVLQTFEKLINELNELSLEKKLLEQIMGDIPEEFQSGFTCELMADPVMLPSSKVIVDRKEIKQHIMLNGETDPFTKTKLTMDQLVEMPEEKAKINNWLAAKKAELAKKVGSKNVKLSSTTSNANELDQLYHDESDTKDEKKPQFGEFN